MRPLLCLDKCNPDNSFCQQRRMLKGNVRPKQGSVNCKNLNQIHYDCIIFNENTKIDENEEMLVRGRRLGALAQC